MIKTYNITLAIVIAVGGTLGQLVGSAMVKHPSRVKNKINLPIIISTVNRKF